MLKKYFLLFSLFCIGENFVQAQPYNIVIKGGHIIDPKNNIDELMDIAIKGDTIVKVAKTIDAKDAIQVVDAHGLYVTPGLIDIHTHDFYGNNPDQYLMDATSCCCS